MAYRNPQWRMGILNGLEESSMAYMNHHWRIGILNGV